VAKDKWAKEKNGGKYSSKFSKRPHTYVCRVAKNGGNLYVNILEIF
jgi:hypothetical protein